jgi:hypothetical protein
MIAFTLCSNNYLPMARALGESFLRHNPSHTFVIGLVDTKDPKVDYDSFAPLEVIAVGDIGISRLSDMVVSYTIIELNTAVKPFLFTHLFNRLLRENAPNPKVCYLDPDIIVFSSLKGIEDTLDSCNVLLTPHLLSPAPQVGGLFAEQIFLNYGIYNLGFCGMRWSETTRQILAWWSERLAEHCKEQVEKGIFVDQLWMNHAPIFFGGVEISRNPCLNVAYWNLHERKLSRKEGVWHVNDTLPLQFYHFSSFQFYHADSLGRYSTRFSLNNRPEMRPLFDEYRTRLRDLGFEAFKKIPCTFVTLRDEFEARQRREYYLKHPFRMVFDYWRNPRRLVKAVGRALRKGNKSSAPVDASSFSSSAK